VDFTTEELFDTIEREVDALLKSQGIEQPPVNAVRLIRDVFRYTIVYAEPDDEPREYGAAPRRRPRPRELQFLPTHSPTAQLSLAARACAKEMIPRVLERLGIPPGTEQRGAQNQLIGLIAPRLVLPTRWYAKACQRSTFDVEQLRMQFSDVAYEWLALRWLDLEDPCVVAIVDDGTVSTRRSNFASLGKKLTDAEERCLELIHTSEEPQRVRLNDWSTRGWPISGGPFNRILLRSVPDEI
jgi:predicted transcriptional regulator